MWGALWGQTVVQGWVVVEALRGLLQMVLGDDIELVDNRGFVCV